MSQGIVSSLSILLFAAVLFGTGYWYFTANAVCDVPIAYRIGTIDPQFGITEDEVRTAVSAAESMWEDATGRNLFTYDEDADFTISFVFDERQRETNEESELRDVLEEKEGMSDSVQREYTRLLEQYDDLKHAYNEKTQSYEKDLQAHNREVERWNNAGGAPEDIYENLSQRQGELAEEQQALNAIAHELNQLVKKINTIGAEGNTLASDYNEIVEEYNSRFTEAKEFTQGDYRGDAIHIYQFDSDEELQIVLAHELGHALSLGHVEHNESVMYHLMETQSLEEGITLFDIHEFERVCGTERFTFWSIL